MRMVESETEFITDPKGHMLAVVDDAAKADAAATALKAAGFEEVRLYRGRAGVAAIDAEGTQHGAVEQAVRYVQDSMAGYEDAASNGSSVVSLLADGADGREAQALSILDRADARAVNSFRSAIVETLRP